MKGDKLMIKKLKIDRFDILNMVITLLGFTLGTLIIKFVMKIEWVQIISIILTYIIIYPLIFIILRSARLSYKKKEKKDVQ